MVGLFKHLEITGKIGLYLRIQYTQRILAGPALKIYCASLLVCKDTARVYAVDKSDFGAVKDMRMEDFWNWENQYG